MLKNYKQKILDFSNLCVLLAFVTAYNFNSKYAYPFRTKFKWRISPSFAIQQRNEPRLVENDENDLAEVKYVLLHMLIILLCLIPFIANVFCTKSVKNQV